MASPGDEIPDFELIRRMAEQEMDFTAARDAWGRLYVRHQRFLLRVCRLDHAYLLGTDGVKDLVHETFLKAFDRAATFDHTEECDIVVQERKCRGWLARIAENLVRDR